MSTVTIEEAQANLPKLIEQLLPGEELIITRDSSPVAKLIAPINNKAQPVFGRGKDKVFIISDDDDHLIDFQEYMP